MCIITRMHLGTINEHWLHIELHACWKIIWKSSLKFKYFTLIFTFRSDSCKWIQLNFQHIMCLHSTKFTLFVTLTQTTVLKLQHSVTISTNSISQAFITASREAVGNYWFTKYYNKINNLITSSAETSKQTTS